MTKSVLVPLDGSPLAEGALATAMWLARRIGARLHLVSATVGPDTVEQQAYLDRVLAGLDIEDVGLHAVGRRFPAPGIIDTVRALPEPMLCMTTKGASGWSATLLGTVTDEVLRTITDPVVLIGPRVPAEGAPPAGPLLISIDGSDGSFAVVPIAAELATRLDVDVEVVTTAQTGRAGPGDARADLADRVLADAVERLGALGVDARAHVLLGAHAAELVVELASERSASLIAIGTHGQSGLSARALGRVATDIVRESTSPVLIRRLRG